VFHLYCVESSFAVQIIGYVIAYLGLTILELLNVMSLVHWSPDVWKIFDARLFSKISY